MRVSYMVYGGYFKVYKIKEYHKMLKKANRLKWLKLE